MESSSIINTNSNIPTGTWTLYFHSQEETKWTLNTFTSLGSIKTWNDFWKLINAVKDDSFMDGMFYMMRDPCPPLWESHQNIYGGCYSFRCQRIDAAYVYINYIIAAMLGKLSTSSENIINGITISSKRGGFNIVKVWNSDAQKFNYKDDINVCFSNISPHDIMYMPFIEKKM
jgi:hypothetical protein